jgi:hypothetical protein
MPAKSRYIAARPKILKLCCGTAQDAALFPDSCNWLAGSDEKSEHGAAWSIAMPRAALKAASPSRRAEYPGSHAHPH